MSREIVGGGVFSNILDFFKGLFRRKTQKRKVHSKKRAPKRRFTNKIKNTFHSVFKKRKNGMLYDTNRKQNMLRKKDLETDLSRRIHEGNMMTSRNLNAQQRQLDDIIKELSIEGNSEEMVNRINKLQTEYMFYTRPGSSPDSVENAKERVIKPHENAISNANFNTYLNEIPGVKRRFTNKIKNMFHSVFKKRTRKNNRKNTRKNNEQLTGEQSSVLRNMEEYAKNIRQELSEKMAMSKEDNAAAEEEEAQKKTQNNNTRKNRFKRNSPKKSRKTSR